MRSVRYRILKSYKDTPHGGDKGTRTPDFCIANAALYQLSYIPKIQFCFTAWNMIHQFRRNCKMKIFFFLFPLAFFRKSGIISSVQN